MIKLTDLEFELLVNCADRADIRSSDRPRDKARTRLKKLGYIIFDREKWRWHVTYDGLDTISAMSLQDDGAP